MKRGAIIIFFSLYVTCSFAQILKPGFSKEEYIGMLLISSRQFGIHTDTLSSPDSNFFTRVYRSPQMGLRNQWELWISQKGVAVISIRGTVSDYVSWVENFYAAMVPAKGSLQLEKDYRFDYHFSDDPKAAVHTGWLIGTAILARDMLSRIDSLYRSGIKDILVMGHSQGGAIAYLLTSHLFDLRATGKLPADLVIKTYCSGAPKPGNLFYAYSFETMTSEGWAYSVVNASDWVPEMPMSIQTTADCNFVNPFVHALPIINKQNFMKKFLLKKAYKRLMGPPRKSVEQYKYYLGEKIYELVKQSLPEFIKPNYFESINYVRTGKTIVLLPDEKYHAAFPDDQNHIFMHHLFEPYLFLINQYNPKLMP